MKREIKFRSWHLENGMLFFDLNSFEKDYHNQYENIMQFTGLKDKNGVDIYEGDVLDCGDKKLKVLFENGCFRTPYIDENGKKSNYRLSGWIECEVIGNIYENIELLKP